MLPRAPSPAKHAPAATPELWPPLFAALLGVFLGLALVKFGNPVILEHLINRPTQDLIRSERNPAWIPDLFQAPESAEDYFDDLYRPWQMHRGFWMILALGLLALKVGRWKKETPRWLLSLGLSWLVWQFVAAAFTVNGSLTRITLIHFAACIICLFLGWYGLPQTRTVLWFWAGVLAGLALVLWNGFNQHYGGLEATRRYIYEQPNWREMSPDFLKRVGSNRIYSSLVYPNALAGAILLLLPPSAVALWQMTRRLANVYRGVLVGLVAYLGVACLVWSGSKAGWLIAMFLGFVVVLQAPFKRQTKLILVSVALVLGLAGFGYRYGGYFKRGATSVSARFDYWRAALLTAIDRPMIGTGPGTFSVPYRRIKTPGAEMARLAHNDYLEQASDSGMPGFLAFFGFVWGSLWYLYRERSVRNQILRFSIWLGLLGWAVQGCVEFGLYIPALAWPAFTLLGWLLGTPPNSIDKPPPPG